MEITTSNNSEFYNKKKWVFPSIGCLSLLIIGGVFAFILYNGITTLFKNSTPYKEAIQLALNNSDVQTILGKPIKVTGIIKGGFKENKNMGNANFEIPLKGSKSRGIIYVVANKMEDQWFFKELTLKIATGNKEINLLPETKKVDF